MADVWANRETDFTCGRIIMKKKKKEDCGDGKVGKKAIKTERQDS